MKKTKKQMVAAGLALVMAVSLVGCGNSGGDSQKEDGQITLKFSFDQGVGEATQKIVDKFNDVGVKTIKNFAPISIAP